MQAHVGTDLTSVRIGGCPLTSSPVKFKTIIEPFRIKTIEPIRQTLHPVVNRGRVPYQSKVSRSNSCEAAHPAQHDHRRQRR